MASTRALLIGHVLAPDLPVCEEEALLRSITVDRGDRSVADNIHERHVSQFQTAVVGSILAECELAIKMYVAFVVLDGDEAGVLVGSAGSAIFWEGFAILGRPPFLQIPGGVVLTSPGRRNRESAHVRSPRQWHRNSPHHPYPCHRRAVAGCPRES